MTEFYIHFSGSKTVVARDADEAMDYFYQDSAVKELQIEEAEVVDEIPGNPMDERPA